jgi:hypothetical protein
MLARILRQLATVVLLTAGPAAQAITFNLYTGGTPATNLGSSWGNVRTFAQAGVELDVSAWGATDNFPSGAFETAYVGRYSTGLGICNRSEGSLSNCQASGTEHQVDNVGKQELILFRFNNAMAFDAITIDPYGTWDRDVSFWVGTVGPSFSLTGYQYTDLASLGFGAQQNRANTRGDAALTINLGSLVGNALLFSAGFNPFDNKADRFKIRSLTASTPAQVVPVPAAAWLFASALGALGAVRRFRR